MKVLGFTLIEVVTLAAWLALTVVQPVVAIVVLLAGLIAEHLVSFRVKNGVRAPLGPVAVIAAIETGTWAGWLALTFINPIVAAIVLFVGLNIGHVLERNNINSRPLFEKFVRRNGGVLDISGIETGIGILWLAIAAVNPIVAAVVLFVGIFVEHTISFAKRPLP